VRGEGGRVERERGRVGGREGRDVLSQGEDLGGEVGVGERAVSDGGSERGEMIYGRLREEGAVSLGC